MSDLKQGIKRSLILLVSVFVAFFVWELINDKDSYTAARSAFEVFVIATLCMAVAEAAHWHRTKKHF